MSTTEPDSYLGRDIAGYRIEEVIGRGGMGVVYRAEHLRLGRKVALKVVAPQIAREEKFRDRFLRESRTAGTLDHPNVVPMYDAGEADGVLYIAMRFVDGVDLATLINRDGPLEPARTARIVAQVASALDAAHEAGLVHRDVKPSNVLLPARGAGRGEHAYLGDFGLTKRVLSESGVTGSSAFLGTIAYVAPEQIEGRPVDARADQYSLACLTYECLTGRKPFERETDIATLYAHIRDPFPSVSEMVPTEISPAVDAVLAKGAAKDPADRYASCGEMADELARVTGAVTPSTGTATVIAPPAAGRRRRRVALAIGGAVVVALGIAAVVLWQSVQTPGPLLPGAGVAVIDAETNRAEAVADLDEDPTAIAADPTAAWVTQFAADQVTRIDATDRSGTTIGLQEGTGPGPITAANGLVWVANSVARTLTEIDAEEPDRSSTSALLFRPAGMAYGDGFLWIIDAQLESVVPVETTPRVDVGEPIAVGGGPEWVAAGGSVAWVANVLDRSLSRIPVGLAAADPAISLDFAPGALALDPEGDALWIVDSAADAVVRFNSRSRQQEASIPVGARPVAVAVGGGGVWVANAGSGTVSRIDPATNTVVATITIGGAPHGVAVSGTTVWVMVAEP